MDEKIGEILSLRLTLKVRMTKQKTQNDKIVQGRT